MKISVRLCGVCLSQFVRFAVEELKTVLIFLCGRGTDSLQSNDDSYSCAIVPRCKIIRKTGKPRILHQNLSYNDVEINLLTSYIVDEIILHREELRRSIWCVDIEQNGCLKQGGQSPSLMIP